MHVVVTGSTGFIGTALVPELLRLGHDVTVLTRRTVNSEASDATRKFAQVLVTDLCEVTERTLPKCDALIHLAGIAQRTGAIDQAMYEKVNYLATVHLAKVAAAIGCQRFIFMSTAKVHAESTLTSINSSSPYNPPDLYSDTKARAEETLLRLDSPMAVTVLRPPAVLGLPAKASFKHLIRLATSGIPVPAPNPPNSRSYICLENLCSAMIRCVESEAPVNGGYLVHDGSPISTEDLLKTIADAHGKKLKVVHVPQSLFKFSNKMISRTTGKNLLAPFFEDFVIVCDQFSGQTGWTSEHTTRDLTKSMFR